MYRGVCITGRSMEVYSMKRSEMIDEIMCCLLSYAATYPQYPLNMLKIAAEEILKMQENKGMQPPNITLKELFPGSILEEDNKHYYACWEPEDE